MNEYINLDENNIDEEHICCTIGDPKHKDGVDKKVGKIAYGKKYEIITEDDNVSVLGSVLGDDIIKFFNEKIIVEKQKHNRIYNLNYKMIKNVSFNKEKKIMVFLLKKEPGIGIKNNLVVASHMDEEGYNYLMDKLSIIKPDFKKILDKSNIKYKIINIYIPLIIIGIFLLVIIISNLGPKEKSEWNKLDDNQKSWYKRNYGNGKSKAIDSAIDNYKSNH